MSDERAERTAHLMASFGECPCDQDDYVTGDCAIHDDTPGYDGDLACLLPDGLDQVHRE